MLIAWNTCNVHAHGCLIVTPYNFYVQVGVDSARLALSLVDYNHELKPAMEYAFGSTFICHTLSDAQRVCLYMYVVHVHVCTV